MNNQVRLFLVILGGIAIATAGCSKKTEPAVEAEDPAAAAAAASLPPVPPLRGAQEVLAAVQAKDYMGSVRALVQVKANATAEQRLDYLELMRTVKDAAVSAMATDPNAQQAYNALRAIEVGR